MSSKSPPPDPAFVFRGIESPVNCLNFIPPVINEKTIRYLAGGTQDGEVLIWNLKSKNVHHKWIAHDSSVLWLKYMNTSSLITCGRSTNVIVWDLGGLGSGGTSKERNNIAVHDYLGFSQCDFINFEGQELLCVPGPGQESFTLWDLNSFEKICSYKPPDAKSWGSVMQCKWVNCNGNLFILVSYENGTLAVWDWSNGKVLNSIQCNDNPISLEFDNHLMKGICGTASEKVVIFSIETDKTLISLDTEYQITNPGIGCARSRIDGKIYALGGWDYRIRLFSWKKHTPLAVLSYHRKSIECLDFSIVSADTFDKGYLLAAGSSDYSVSVWNVFNKDFVTL